jgi:hypothetical protein
MINFEFKFGWLKAGCPELDTEWEWGKGDPEIVVSQGGEFARVIAVPALATVIEVKALIRRDLPK